MGNILLQFTKVFSATPLAAALHDAPTTFVNLSSTCSPCIKLETLVVRLASSCSKSCLYSLVCTAFVTDHVSLVSVRDRRVYVFPISCKEERARFSFFPSIESLFKSISRQVSLKFSKQYTTFGALDERRVATLAPSKRVYIGY